VLIISGCGSPLAQQSTAGLDAPRSATATPLAVAYTPPSVALTVTARITPGGSATPRSAATPVPTLAPGTPVSYAQVQQLFTNFCVGCHPGQQGLNLSPDRSYTMLVSVHSNEVPSLDRVRPGSAEQSYLYQKLAQDKPRIGLRMPLNGDPLTLAEIAIVREWINQGASAR